jgi:hypothetical protein
VETTLEARVDIFRAELLRSELEARAWNVQETARAGSRARTSTS